MPWSRDPAARGEPHTIGGVSTEVAASDLKFAEHAPHGKREQALRHAGLWERIKEHLVLGENISHAAELATIGGAQGGIIAYSLALSPLGLEARPLRAYPGHLA